MDGQPILGRKGDGLGRVNRVGSWIEKGDILGVVLILIDSYLVEIGL